MKIASVLQGVFLLMVAVGIATAAAANKPGYTPFPAGAIYDYPQKWSTIQNWIDQKNWPKIRQHGWRLFVGVNQPAVPHSSTRIFETWYTLPETFAKQSSGLTAVAGSTSTSHVLPHRKTVNEVQAAGYGNHAAALKTDYGSQCHFAGTHFLNNGDLMIAGVFYTEEFYQHIRNKRYFSSDHLEELWQGKPTAIKSFPDGSFQVKHMYWPVPKEGFAALPVFPDYNPAPDPANPSLPVKPTTPVKYNGYETWNRAVAVTAGAATGQTADVTYAWRDYYGIPVVPISNFYHKQVTQADYDTFNSTDRCILNQSANAVYRRDFKPGDYLITIAMHITVREKAYVPGGLLPDPANPQKLRNTWSLQTFWYSGSPADPGFSSRYAKDKPADFPPGPWQSYSMCQSYDAIEPKEGDSKPHVCANPYIELVFPETYRSVSSCITCHSAGAYPSASSLTDTLPGRAHYNSEQRGAVPMNYFRALLYTDFSWSIPLSAAPDVSPNQ